VIYRLTNEFTRFDETGDADEDKTVKFIFVLLLTMVALTFGASALELSSRDPATCQFGALCHQ
jgi:hypothetical protein